MVDLPADTGGPTPWWARPQGVAIVIGVYCLLFLFITGVLSSSFNIDDEIAAYSTQALYLNYSSRNPPLYYWILYGLQRIVDPTPFSFAIVRYTLLFLFGWIAYLIARRTIADPRLQATSVFALSLLWLIGYHTHRVNTHSDLMIVFIAWTALVLVELRARPTAGRYALLGAAIALGTLSKFGYLAFLACAAAGAVSVTSYRRVLLDRRLIITMVVAGIPLATFFAAGALRHEHYVNTVMRVVLPGGRPGLAATLKTLADAWLGYVMPFLAIFLLVLWPWRAQAADRSGSAMDDARRFLRNTLIAGTIIACGGVLAAENTNIRDRYFHAFYPLLTVYAFAEADRRPIDRRRLSAFSTIMIAVAGVVAGIFAVVRLAPDPRLCGECDQSMPEIQFSRILHARFGATPTLVTPINAGQFRIGMPDARVVELAGRALPPPARRGPGGPCVLVWNDISAKQPWIELAKKAAAQAGVRVQDAERITVPRFGPLRWDGAWPMNFYVLPMPDNAPPCR